MNPHLPGGGRRLLLTLAALLAMAPQAGAPPAWWSQRQVIVSGAAPDNYAPANLGQAKHMATQALAEMNDKLAAVGGAGFAITDLFPAPPPRPGEAGYNPATWQAYAAANYAPLNLGQLKNLSYRFYDRLKAIGYTLPSAASPQGYPWTASTSDDDNYAPANLGQLKNVFSFDLSLDPSNNGLPPAWELQNFGSFRVDPNADPDGDGLTNLQEFQLGTNPNDPFDGPAPLVTKASVDPQTGRPGALLGVALTVQVTVSSSGAALSNIPVTFQAVSGGGVLKATSSAAFASACMVRTDGRGQARAYFQLPNVNQATCQIQASVAKNSQMYALAQPFTAYSNNSSGAVPSPFAITNCIETVNPDGSEDLTWTNCPDNDSPIPIWSLINGQWVQVDTVPAGTTSYHFAQP